MADKQTQEIKKEDIVFEYLNKFCPNKSMFMALYINVHSLSDKVRTVSNRKSIVEILMPSVKSGLAEIFTLLNEDIVLVFDKKVKDEVASSLVRIKFLSEKAN